MDQIEPPFLPESGSCRCFAEVPVLHDAMLGSEIPKQPIIARLSMVGLQGIEPCPWD